VKSKKEMSAEEKKELQKQKALERKRIKKNSFIFAICVSLPIFILSFFMSFASLTNFITLGLIATLGFIYFQNNPEKRDRAFRLRTFYNWMMLGLAYAFLVMGRYNLVVSEHALGELMTKKDFGLIFGAGTTTYALSFIINGPLVDKIGGRMGMIIGMIGSAVMNIIMGFYTYSIITSGYSIPPLYVYALLYSGNMYFQSYGAVSIVKVNSFWFSVEERGVFGGIFGSLIALGLFFAYDWSSTIVNAMKQSASQTGLVSSMLNSIGSLFGLSNPNFDQTWFVFLAPGLIMAAILPLVWLIVRERPSHAGLADIRTRDASDLEESSGKKSEPLTHWGIIKKILMNPIMVTIALIEFCSGTIRNGIMSWYKIYVESMALSGMDLFFRKNTGLILCFAGIAAAFFAGFLSDKVFQHRRTPVAALLYTLMFASVGLLAIVVPLNAFFMVGLFASMTTMFILGVHGMLSGTATMDFGGTKGAATAVGLIDGFVYLGVGFQSICLGFIIEDTSWSWNAWGLFLLPFTIIGFIFAFAIRKETPTTTKDKTWADTWIGRLLGLKRKNA